MKRYKLFALIACIATIPALATIPPAFGGDSTTMRKDLMTRAYVTPKRIVWQQGSKLSGAQNLLKPNTGQADLAATGLCTMITTPGDTASLILDFGRELHGGIKIVISSCAPLSTPRFRIRLGESVTETCAELKERSGNPNGATNDHAIRDFELDLPFYGQIELGSSGYRFARLDLLTPNQTVNLKEATAVFRYKDVPYRGSFRCSDERLNQIWDVGAYTVHLNMQEYIWDGIKRDRLIWLGDMHPETSTISAVFGDDSSFYASLDLACQQWPLPQWLNGMSAYSMWYLIIQHDWYMQNGRRDYLERHRDYITGLIDLIDSRVAEDGSETLGGGYFLDWPSSPNEAGVKAGYRALLTWALNDAAVLAELLGDNARAEKCRVINRRLAKRLLPDNGLKQAAALQAIAGQVTPEKACQSCILPSGAQGFSTFYGYYMLQALAMAGHYQEALDVIRRFWGGMLDLGATTFWEDFNLEWTENAARIDGFVPEGKKDIHGDFGAYCYPGFRHSFCHGWASGPTAWMSQHVLGCRPIAPGCAKLEVKPHLADLAWAEGTYPTPKGDVWVRAERQPDGSVKTKVRAPRGIKIVK